MITTIRKRIPLLIVRHNVRVSIPLPVMKIAQVKQIKSKKSPCTTGILRNWAKNPWRSISSIIKGVTHVPECNAYIVHNDKKYFVTLHTEICPCSLSTKCHHHLAVQMFVGLPVDADNREVSLRSLYKRSLKRSDNKSRRKKPRTKDVNTTVHPAPSRFHSRTKRRTKHANKRKSWNLTTLKRTLLHQNTTKPKRN